MVEQNGTGNIYLLVAPENHKPSMLLRASDLK
jgi:hypothetical protein